ncbi:MAG: superoxide dismutase [Pelotomaculum sp.]|jgi:Fe-Mn family superoxide dismutase
MMMSGENFNRPPHLSEEQLAEHSRLYPEFHASKLKEIEARLIKADTICVNPTYCQLRSLKKEQAYAINSIRLHALYFDNYGHTEEQPSDELMAFMERDFGSYEEWEKQFRGLSMCSRGWVVLGFDLKDGVLRSFITDDHAEGVWLLIPILVLDIFEHAYYKAFNSREEYVESFFRTIRWDTVNRRFKAVKIFYHSMSSML